MLFRSERASKQARLWRLRQELPIRLLLARASLAFSDYFGTMAKRMPRLLGTPKARSLLARDLSNWAELWLHCEGEHCTPNKPFQFLSLPKSANECQGSRGAWPARSLPKCLPESRVCRCEGLVAPPPGLVFVVLFLSSRRQTEVNWCCTLSARCLRLSRLAWS